MNRGSLHTRLASGIYTSLFLDTDELKISFEKQATGAPVSQKFGKLFGPKKAIFSLLIFKDREVYTPETYCKEWNFSLY